MQIKKKEKGNKLKVQKDLWQIEYRHIFHYSFLNPSAMALLCLPCYCSFPKAVPMKTLTAVRCFNRGLLHPHHLIPEATTLKVTQSPQMSQFLFVSLRSRPDCLDLHCWGHPASHEQSSADSRCWWEATMIKQAIKFHVCWTFKWKPLFFFSHLLVLVKSSSSF